MDEISDKPQKIKKTKVKDLVKGTEEYKAYREKYREKHLDSIKIGQKQCFYCSKFKEISMYSKTKNTCDGYKYSCDFCLSNKENILLDVYIENPLIKELFPERFSNDSQTVPEYSSTLSDIFANIL
jgi:hypothetical protein